MVFRHLRRGSKGFTLIELMIVIAIIGILAAIAIPNFMSARDKAKRSGAKQTLGALRLAMDMYLTDYDSYPTSLATTQASAVQYLGPYTNITQLYATTLDGSVLTYSGVLAASYSIAAKAVDRPKTLCTANQDNVWSDPP